MTCAPVRMEITGTQTICCIAHVCLLDMLHCYMHRQGTHFKRRGVHRIQHRSLKMRTQSSPAPPGSTAVLPPAGLASRR